MSLDNLAINILFKIIKNYTMKKILLILFFAVLGKISYSQGLENIIVEKYYVSNAADAAGSQGALPAGSVTYRFFADLATGYKLQAVYGASGHDLKFISTANIFNNTDRGATIPNWTKAQAANNSVMLDSYLTIGAATNNNNIPTSQVGILKTEDNTVGTVVNADGILQNADPSAGIAISLRDGFTNGTLQDVQIAASAATITAMDAVFGAANPGGTSFILSDGSIAAIPNSGVAGMSGPTANNRVFLGQITTTGSVHYELNLQITNSTGTIVQNYVALNPTGGELSIPSLKGDLGVSLAGEPSSNGALTFGTTTSNSMVVNFAGGNGQRRILLARALSAVTANPVDGTNYIANSIYGSGDQIGTGNFVVYNGTGLTTTVTGLNSNTVYHFRLLEYNNNGVSGAENYFTSTFTSGSNITSSLGTTYSWNQTGAGPFNFNTASNWTPARTTPANDDILVFGNGTTNSIISNVVPQTVARILVQNNTSIILEALGSNTLTVNGNSSSIDDFRVDAGSSLTLGGTAPVSIYVGSSATANIYGNITLATSNSLTSGIASGIKFKSGANCTTASTFSGAPFGLFGAIANSILFESGSTYTHNAGNNPFQKTAPATNVVFQTGSNQVWNTVSGFEASGRTYGNLTLNAIISSPLTSSFSSQNLIQGSAGQITFTGTGSSAINISGDVLNNSSVAMNLTSGTGGVNLTKVGIQSIGGSGAGSVSFLPTLSLVSGNTTNCTKSLALNNLAGAGTLKFNAAGLNASFTGTISGTVGITAFGNYDLNLSFTGTGPIGNLKVTNGINNITINRIGSTSILTSPLNVFGIVTLTNGDLNSNGQLTLRSIATRQGIISGANLGSVTGSVNVQRYIAGSASTQIRYLSSPVSGITTNAAWSDDFSVQGTYPFTYNPNVTTGFIYPTVWTFDATNVAPFSAWESANTATLTPLMGVSATCGATTAKTLDVFGPVNNGAYSQLLNVGFNLIGNPYPSPIRWSLLQGLNPGLLGASYYAYVGATGTYGYFNGVVGTNGLTDTIYTSQGFLVEGLSSSNLNVNNTIRFGSNAPSFFRESVVANNLVKLNILDAQGNLDQVAFYSTDKGKNYFNPETDASKAPSTPGSSIPEISLIIDNSKVAIKEFGNGMEEMIPLSIVAKAEGFYTFNVNEYSNFQNNVSVYFIDIENNQRIKLCPNMSYQVHLSAGNFENRFYLNYVSNSPLGVNESGNESINCYANNQKLIISNSSIAQNCSIQLFDLSGKEIVTKNMFINKGNSSIELPEVSEGVYMVRMVSNSGTITKKIHIK